MQIQSRLQQRSQLKKRVSKNHISSFPAIGSVCGVKLSSDIPYFLKVGKVKDIFEICLDINANVRSQLTMIFKFDITFLVRAL